METKLEYIRKQINSHIEILEKLVPAKDVADYDQLIKFQIRIEANNIFLNAWIQAEVNEMLSSYNYLKVSQL